MPKIIFTEKEKICFKVWLLRNNLSLRQFAVKCGVSYAYISSVVCGNVNVTTSVRETFKKGGYIIKE